MKKLVPILSILLPIPLLLSSCETPGRSAGLGAAIGAAAGAVASRGRPSAILQGAALGAATGYVVGKVIQHDRREEDGYYEDDPNYPEHGRYSNRDFPMDDRSGLPIGRPTRHEGFVISPYPPHNKIDVHGIPPGAKVMDPSVNQVFINP